MSDDVPEQGPPPKRPTGPPDRSAPPTANVPPPASTPPSPKPTANATEHPAEAYVPDDASLHEGASWTTWVVVTLLIGLMVGAYFYLDPILNPHKYQQHEIAAAEAASDDGTKKRKKRKRKKRRKRSSVEAFLSGHSERDREDPNDFYEDEEFWSDDELETSDRFQLGDVFAEEEEFVEEFERPEPEPAFEPPPEMWQPSGRYTPTSSWSGPGANRQDVVEMSMDGAAATPLKPEEIRATLNVSRLMPCYREIAKKVPRMKGRVKLEVHVEPDGRVSKVRVSRSALRSKMVEDCIVRKTRGLRFPATDGRRTKFDTHFDFD